MLLHAAAQIAAGFSDSTIRVWYLDPHATRFRAGSASTAAGKKTDDDDDVPPLEYDVKMDGTAAAVGTAVDHVPAVFGAASEAAAADRIADGDVKKSGDAKGASAAGSDEKAAAGQGLICDTLVGHRSPVVRVAVSADGKFILSGSIDGSIRLWIAGVKQTAVRVHCEAL